MYIGVYQHGRSHNLSRSALPTDSPLAFAQVPEVIVGGYGRGPSQLRRPHAAHFDSLGRLYILDPGNQRVAQFDPSGRHLGNWYYGDAQGGDDALGRLFPGAAEPMTLTAMTLRADVVYATDGKSVWSRALESEQVQQVALKAPGQVATAMAVTGDGRIVLGGKQVGIEVFLPDGRKDARFVGAPDLHRDCAALALDADDRIYVGYRRVRGIHCYNERAELLSVYGDILRAEGLYIDAEGRVWYCGRRTEALEVFSAAGDHLATFPLQDPRGLGGTGTGLAYDATHHRLAEVDANNYCVRLWRLDAGVTEPVDRTHPTPDYPAGRTPDHVLLTWQGDPKTEAAVTWRTLPGVHESIIEWGELASPSEEAPPSVSRALGRSRFLQTNLGPLRSHAAELTGLRPETTYAYRVGDGTPEGWSRWFTFRTAPGRTVPFTFGVIGEIHEGRSPHMAVTQAMAADDPAFVLNTGDLVTRGGNQVHWDEWFYHIGDTAAVAPHMAAMGNHDMDRGHPSQYWETQLALPRKSGCPGLEGYAYSFDYSNAHFVILSTSQELAPQVEWLRADLAANKQPWTIVALHIPPFTSKAERVDNDLKDTFVPVFEEFRVDLAFSGHDATYMRTYPIRNQTPLDIDADAPRYIVIVSGEKFYSVSRDLPWIQVGIERTTMYGRVRVDGGRLHFEALTGDGTLIDELILEK